LKAIPVFDINFISQVFRFSDILNKSQVDANMKNWQIYGHLHFCDTIYKSVIWDNL